ncbi:hypothetical protein RUM44_005908 [Polyplax serrata]|uniref:Uncharacterized protein n=1 Tax=Polyplax serrata TaxID=468196 RepID=A0ABR1AYE3_POLSC
MFWSYQKATIALLLCAFIRTNHAVNDENKNRMQPLRLQSPMLEVLMHLPPDFNDVKSFKNYLGVKPDRLDSKRLVDVRTYDIARPNVRGKREASENTKEEKPIAEKLTSLTSEKSMHPDTGTKLPVPDAIRGPAYTPYAVKEFDLVDVGDPEYPKRRKTDSNDSRDDSQRDKRTFGDSASDIGESTTPLPYWKRKKESPPFITGRGSTPKANDYSPPQHRSLESARESHSLKNLDKSVQTNEIGRPNQDNYYSSTNRRTYSRQSDKGVQSAPKSVYDTIDYNKKNQNGGRMDALRYYDDRKDFFRDRRPPFEQYTNRQYMYNYPMSDRPYYQPPPFPSEVIGRGVEYYHRTYEPATGRMVYYANMPENGRSLDYRYMEPVNRNFFVGRPFMQDHYNKNFDPPGDYRYPMGGGRPMDYVRAGRSNLQAYSYSFPEGDKYQRDARFTGGYTRANRIPEDVRNKTYIIYDADEARAQVMRNQYPGDINRLSYAPPPPPNNNYQVPQEPYRRFSASQPVEYLSQSAFPFRNQVYPPPPTSFWGVNQGIQGEGRWQVNGITSSIGGPNLRSLNSPEVQLPLTTVIGNQQPGSESDKKKKA